jgi:hypothetical protein
MIGLGGGAGCARKRAGDRAHRRRDTTRLTKDGTNPCRRARRTKQKRILPAPTRPQIAWRLRVRPECKSDKLRKAENLLKTKGRKCCFFSAKAENIQKTNTLTKNNRKQKNAGTKRLGELAPGRWRGALPKALLGKYCGLGSRSGDSGFRIQDSRFKTQESRFRSQEFGFRIRDSGFGIPDSGARIQELGTES